MKGSNDQRKLCVSNAILLFSYLRRFSLSIRNKPAQGQSKKVVEMGRYKQRKCEDAHVDQHYWGWVLDNINHNTASGMKALDNYFVERQDYKNQPGATAPMAIHEISN